MLHTVGLEKKIIHDIFLFPFAPHPLSLCYYQQYYNRRVSNVHPIPNRREVMREAFPPFWTVSRASPSMVIRKVSVQIYFTWLKNDFMINSQRILKAIWSFVYYLERRKKGWWSTCMIQSNKMLKSFKSTSLNLAWRPKAKLLRETWSAGY